MNRLENEASPYLRQHAANPVDWYPWGEAAFARARELQRPIFLSIGYFTCHWCHVMERESFENPTVAEALNRDFIAIKVDREERPDVDRIYMSYVQATTGSGGWPLSAFLTPELQPFFGATYFPPAQFLRVLASVAGAWQQDRARILESSQGVGRELARILTPPEPVTTPARALMDEVWPRLFEHYRDNFDAVHGGFGGAPKFPHPVALEFLLRYERRHRGQARQMLTTTLHAMATGGLHDLVGGGFHRYSVDAAWRVPHFEKMLYDQAQLALVYLGAWQLLREDTFAATARSTLDFVLREMTAPEGGFFAAQDADSPTPEDPTQAREGAYYLWAQGELEPTAGIQVGEFEGKYILYGERNGVAKEVLDALYTRRRQRPHPPTDDKVLTAWNGLMISALARAGAALAETRYVSAAQAAGQTLAQRWDGQRLLRTPTVAGFAEDYAFFIRACLDLQQADFDPAWLTLARDLQTAQEANFAAPGGGYFATAGASGLILRLQDDQDGAEPATASVALANLMRLDFHFAGEGWRERAGALIASAAARVRRVPESQPLLAANLEWVAMPARSITVAGPAEVETTRTLLRVARRSFQPATILVCVGAPQAEGFVCEDTTCGLPVSDAEKFAASLEI